MVEEKERVHEKKMVEPNNSKLKDSEEKVTTNDSTLLTTIGTTMIRIGIIISFPISIFYNFYLMNLTIVESNIAILQVFLLISIIVLNIGILIIIYGLEKSKNLDIPSITVFIKNVKVYVILSLILANRTLSLIPITVLAPFSLLFPLDPQGIGYSPFQAFIFPFILRSDYDLLAIIEQYLSNGYMYIFKLLGLSLVIFTLFLLMFQLRGLIREKNNLQVNNSPRKFWFELSFRLILILLLAYETISPMWDNLLPNVLFSLSNYQVIISFIDTTITPPITLLCLIFLILGSFRHSYFVINK